MKNLEHLIQCDCVNWFRFQYPKHIIFAIPNGGQRNVVVAAKLKAEGVLAGIPDLFIPVAKGKFHGLFIEMKAEGNKPTLSQREMINCLSSEGYACEVCWSIDDFMRVVNWYFKQ